MITLKNLQWSTPAISVDLSDFQKEQIASKIQKILMREFSITCEVEVSSNTELLFEEKETLSHKLLTGWNGRVLDVMGTPAKPSKKVFNEKDVKEYIKKFIESMINTEADSIDIRKKAKEIFGDDLV